MITVDKFLINLLSTAPDAVASLPQRDLKVLKSLAKIVISPIFITENQGNLLVKILKEHQLKLSGNILEILESIGYDGKNILTKLKEELLKSEFITEKEIDDYERDSGN
jgi:hypothetical protein